MAQTIKEEDNIQDEWYQETKNVTLDTLPAFLRKLTEDYGHDYGTICHALAAAGLAAVRAVDKSPAGGITGFQAGAVMWQFMIEWQGWRDKPMRLVDFSNILYPQYEHKFRPTITPSTWEWLQTKAAENIATVHKETAQVVKQHWMSIVKGKVPFGLTIEED